MNEELPRSIDTVVIGAGQAGLIMSWHLQAAGRPHVVLDRRETLGGGWQDRWDGFIGCSGSTTTRLRTCRVSPSTRSTWRAAVTR